MEDYRKHLVFISYYYPPRQHVASERVASFVKYLSADLYRITVICHGEKRSDSEESGQRVIRFPSDGLMDRSGFTGKESRVAHMSKALKNQFILKTGADEYRSWTKRCIREGLDILKQDPPNLILSSYAPVSSHLVGLAYAEYFSSSVFVLDMRDEMGQHPSFSPDRRKRLRKLEERLSRRANGLISVSTPILEQFKESFDEARTSFELIFNGYDSSLNSDKVYGDKFQIGYFGSFYGDIHPKNFLEALRRLITDEPELAKELSILFHTNVNMVSIPREIEDIVELHDKISRTESLEKMRESEALLLIHPTGERKGVYTGKLFEYLAAKRPILALVDTEDVAAELIREAEAGIVCPNEDIEKIQANILHLYQNWKHKKRIESRNDVIQKYARKEQAQRLGRFLDLLLQVSDNHS